MQLFDHELERKALALLADISVLESPSNARVAIEQLAIRSEAFHMPAHREVFETVAATVQDNQPIDVVTLAGRLKGSSAVGSAGGRDWLLSLFTGQASALPGALPGYTRELEDLAARRQLTQLGRLLLEKAQGPEDPRSAIRQASGVLAGIGNSRGAARSLRDVVEDVVGELAEVESGKRRPVIETGIGILDRVIGGLQETLTVIGALPGVGKSALLATITQNLLKRGVRVGMFSLEDKDTWLVWRLISQESGVTQFLMRNRRLNDNQQENTSDACKRVWEYAQHGVIDDRSGLTPLDVVAGARDMILNHGVQVILVDHLGELRFDTKRRDRFDLDVAEGLSELRSIAKQHRVPVVCATHLRREADTRTEVKLSDFANSAAIERQARVALGLSREADSGRLIVTVLKQTNGVAGKKLVLDFHGAAAMVKPTGGEEMES